MEARSTGVAVRRRRCPEASSVRRPRRATSSRAPTHERDVAPNPRTCSNTSVRAVRNERVTGPPNRGRGPTSGVRSGRRDRARTLENEEISRVQRTLTVRSHLAILPARSASTQDARRRLRSRTRAAPKYRTDVLRVRRRSCRRAPRVQPARAAGARRRADALVIADRLRLPRLTARRVAFAGHWTPSWNQRPSDRSGSHPMGSARTLRAGSPSSIPITLDATHRPPRAIEPLRACFDRQ